MTTNENVALGIRKPGRETVEFSILPVRDADAMLPVLRRDFDRQPHRVFGDLALDRRLIEVPDSRPFHDVAREAGATRWLMHQAGQWNDGAVMARSAQSLLSRWYRTAKRSGGDRFRPDRGHLGSSNGGGGRNNCIMGAATELFLDDYPTALSRVEVERPHGGFAVHYVDFSRGGEPIKGVLPNIVKHELGVATDSGMFALNPAVGSTLEEYTGMTAQTLEREMGWLSLVRVNDHLLDWPLAGELMAIPAPGLFTR